MKKKILNFFKISIALLLVWWLFRRLDWELVRGELVGINYLYLLIFVLLQLGAIFISAQKWQMIARYQAIQFTVREGFDTYLMGTFINNFLPSTIGGDVYRGLWLAKKNTTKSLALSTVVFDRFLGLIVTAFIALIGGIFVWRFTEYFPPFLILSYLGIFGFLGFLSVVVFLLARFKDFIPLLSYIKSERLQNTLLMGVRYLQSGLWRDGVLWTSLFIFVGLGLSNYVLFLALGYHLPFLAFFGLVCMMALYVSLPISINNIGVKEWAYGVLFVLLGVSFEAAITVALLSRFFQTLISLGALPLYLKQKKSEEAMKTETIRG